jgi:GrpB-like predicted nucleotidyltransferase (UPF0157 family)
MADERAARMADATRVLLARHDPAWAEMAAAEGARLAGALGENLIAAHHIGSTALPGIAAKPVVDLMPVVRSLETFEARRCSIEALGYLWRGAFGIEGRRYCVLERDGKRVFHVHFYAEGNANIARQLAFRDYLLAHSEEAQAYERIKREAAAAHPDNSMAYNDHKSGWIRACQQRAEAWAARRQGP